MHDRMVHLHYRGEFREKRVSRNDFALHLHVPAYRPGDDSRRNPRQRDRTPPHTT
ncbi:hypothetical protein [Halolamina litorea]|uniref:Uncharacterized protein n=1 Tax=Halolamina litorea TaxID=1515593 RepID=A0ABD6BV43_9EURY